MAVVVEEEEEPSAAVAAPASSSSSSFVVSSSSSSVHWQDRLLLVSKLWCAGFRDACCLNRAYLFCRRSRRVLKKTGQCFLLNGCIFLGSILLLQQVVIPTLQWLLNTQLHNSSGSNTKGLFYWLLQNLIIGMYYVFLVYPLYIISFVLSCLWYNEIAAHAFGTLDKQGAQPRTSSKGKAPRATNTKSSTAIESLMLGIGEQIYSIIMLSAFFVEILALSFIPYVGQLLKFFLLSWLYAYYFFDYKWGLRRWSLEKRLLFFETNWAFFAGFGTPCVLATFFLTPLVAGGVMAVVFPLFVLVATASNPEEVVSAYLGSNRDGGLQRLHLFYFANIVTVPFVRLFQTHAPTSSTRRKTQ